MNSPEYSASEHTIAGGWLGTYAYGERAGRQPPVRFEATWAAGDAGRFTGTVLDDGPLGEAHTDGMQSGRQVAFTKVYVNDASSLLHPIAYEGTLSEDGTQVTGTWRLGIATGTWDARRLWSATEGTEQVQAAADMDTARELVSLG